jgi:hypothetical protein
VVLRSYRLSLAVLLALLWGCGAGSGAGVDSTPERLDGTESHEFEPDDLERAEAASPAVKAYCAKAVSEAQRLGCEAHVTDEDLP